MEPEGGKRDEKKADDGLKKHGEGMRRAAQFTTIPFMLLGGLFVGYAIGWALDKWLRTGGIVTGIMCLVGVAAGFREIIYMLKFIEKD